MSQYPPLSKGELMPLPEILVRVNKKKQLNIGIPRERQFQEKRVCLTPDAVSILHANGHQIYIETGAGEGANYSDVEYSNAGAHIKYETREVYEQPLVIKVEPPSKEEISFLQPKNTLISTLQPNKQDKQYFELLQKKKCTAIAFDFITDETDSFTLVRMMSEIAGTASILVGSQLLSNTKEGCGILLGGIPGVPSCEVVIIGAGTVGFNACRAAIGLGALVRVFDCSINKLRRLQLDLGNRVFTSLIEPKVLRKSLMRCNLAIGAIRSEGRSPCIVSEEMVMKMKKGAVIVDVCIDSGGCFETSEITTHNHPTLIKHDVIHYGVTNIASQYSRTATLSLSHFFLPNLIDIGDTGDFDFFIKKDMGWRNGVYMYKGILTKKNIGEWFGMDFKDIGLFLF